MYESGDLRKGLKLELNGQPYIVIHFEFVKPGKGRALYKCKLKNIITGVQFDKTFRSVDKFVKADLEELKMEYLYTDNLNYYFIDLVTYDQIFINAEQIKDTKNFLKENTVCNIIFFKKKPISISLPNFMNYKVVSSTPWVKGDTSSGGSKSVKIETGLLINVPTFINEGETIKIDTRTGEYIERVK